MIGIINIYSRIEIANQSRLKSKFTGGNPLRVLPAPRN